MRGHKPIIVGAVPFFASLALAAEDLGDLGRFAKWGKVEIVLRGPESQGGGRPNPFSVAVDGAFTSPTGKKYAVPGFYDGDGRGGLDGGVWKVRFSADETGRWTFVSRSARRGSMASPAPSR